MRTEARAQRVEQALERPMLVAAALVVPLLLLQRETGQPWATIAVVLNWGTWLAFVVELCVMMAVVPDRRAWLRAHPIEVLVTICTPPVLPAGIAAARALRLLRVLRLLRLAPAMRRLLSDDGLKYAGVLAVLTLFGGGTAFAALEPNHSTWSGIYWAATTMTTVGYGDIPPTTAEARALALFVMVVGIGFGSLMIGAIADRFVRQDGASVESEPADLGVAIAELRRLTERLEAVEARLASELSPAAGPQIDVGAPGL